LPTQELEVRVGVADADPLVAGDPDPATTMVDPRPDAPIALPWRHVDHAEASLGGAPEVTIARRDELVGGVRAEVAMVVAGWEFEQPVAGGDEEVGIVGEAGGLAVVWRCCGETTQVKDE